MGNGWGNGLSSRAIGGAKSKLFAEKYARENGEKSTIFHQCFRPEEKLMGKHHFSQWRLVMCFLGKIWTRISNISRAR